MKTLSSYFAVVLMLLCIYSNHVNAQDWMKLDPKMLKSLADTTFLRAYEVTLAPGEKSKMHSHPAEFFYALTDIKLNVHYADGKTDLYDLKAGDSGVSGPERPHWTENIGTKTARWIEVELKEHPYMAPKK